MQYELFGWDLYGNPVTGEQNTDCKFMVHKSFWSSHLKKQCSAVQHRSPLIHPAPRHSAEPTCGSFCCQAKDHFPLSLYSNSIKPKYHASVVLIFTCVTGFERQLLSLQLQIPGTGKKCPMTAHRSKKWQKRRQERWETAWPSTEFWREGPAGQSLGLYRLSRDGTQPEGTGEMNEQRKGGQAQRRDNIREKRKAGVGRSKTDVMLKQRALEHHPKDGQVPGTAFNIGWSHLWGGIHSLR